MKLTQWMVIVVILTAILACEESNRSDSDSEQNSTDRELDEARLGSQGESCTSRSDCKSGLACYAQMCTQSKEENEEGTDSNQTVSDPRGGEGESCASRRDCQEGLGCFSGVCLVKPRLMDAGSSIELVSPGTRSGLGESCRARNDCIEELTCVNATCVDDNVAIEVTAKSCVRIDCSKNEDCCATFEQPNYCESYKTQCEEDPVVYLSSCQTYWSQCECHDKCIDSICAKAGVQCKDDTHCTQPTRPFCVELQCVECKKTEDCTIEGHECVDNVCKEPPPPCINNEQCPLMYACQDGDCVEVGCGSDRECFFLTGFDRSVCKNKTCTVPCEYNADCVDPAKPNLKEDPFWVCKDGGCVFVGCKTDEECRIYLGVENQESSGAQAKCQ